MVGLDRWADDGGMDKLDVSLAFCSAVDITDMFDNGELLAVDDKLKFLILVGSGEIVMLVSRGC